MRRWQLTTILIILGAFGVLIAATWFDLGEGGLFSRLYSRMDASPPLFRHPWLHRPPGPLMLLTSFITLYLSGLILLFLFPQRVRHMRVVLAGGGRQAVRLAALGFLALVLVISVGIISAINTVTFPMMIFLGGLLFLCSFAGVVALAYTTGYLLFQRAGWDHLSPAYALGAGLLAVFALTEIPYLGILMKILIASLGIGLVIATRFGSGRPWSLAPLLEE